MEQCEIKPISIANCMYTISAYARVYSIITFLIYKILMMLYILCKRAHVPIRIQLMRIAGAHHFRSDNSIRFSWGRTPNGSR